MKKIIIIIGLISFSFCSLFAQGPFAYLNIGSAFGISKDIIGIVEVSSISEGSITNIEGTYGNGIPITLGTGYMLTDHIGMEIGLNYFKGFEIKSSDKTIQPIALTDITTSKTNQIRILPALILSTGTDNKLSLYMKSALILPIGGSTKFVRTVKSPLGNTDIEGKITGKFALGYSGSIGVKVSLGDKLAIFAELQSINLAIKRDASEITKYDIAGNSVLQDLEVSDKKTIFVDEISSTSNTDDSKPSQALTSSTNYNSLGINIGLKFNF